MVKNLKQLLLGPGSTGMGGQIVQHQNGCGTHLLEKIAVRNFTVWGVGGSQVIQKVGRNYEKGSLAPFNAPAGDRYRQVSFPRTTGAGKNHPARR